MTSARHIQRSFFTGAPEFGCAMAKKGRAMMVPAAPVARAAPQPNRRAPAEQPRRSRTAALAATPAN